MREPFGLCFGGFAIAFALAGCSGASSPITTGAVPPGTALMARSQAPDTGSCAKDVVFVSDYGANIVFGFSSQGGKPTTVCAELSNGISGPQGLAADRSRHIYIVNTNDSQVLEVAPPYAPSSIVRTISETYFPAGVAVSDSGLLAIENVCSAPSCLQGDVAFYRKGATTPCASVSSSGLYRPYFGAFDASGNLYVEGENASFAPVFGQISGGCRAKKFVPLTIQGITNPSLFGIDTNGNIGIYAGTSGSQTIVDVFAPGNFNQPKFTFTFQGSGGVVPFDKSGKRFWTTEAGSGIAAEFDYPKGGAPVATLTGFVEPIGVTAAPPGLP